MKENFDVLNLKNFLYINTMSIVLCYRSSAGATIDNNYYKYSSWDIIFRLISSPNMMIVIWYLFFIIMTFSNFFLKNPRYIEVYRYNNRKEYFNQRVKKIIIFSIYFNLIFFVNIYLSSLIKARDFSGWGQAVKLIFGNTDKYGYLIFMNGEILKYNPLIQFILYGVILTIFFILIGILMEVFGCIINNKIIICLLSIVVYLIISLQVYVYKINTVCSKLMYNQLDLNINGFNLFQNRYYNMYLSIFYLASICMVIYFAGKYACSKREFY